MDALRTLQILISSRTPLIAIETLEEERVEQALERVAQRLRTSIARSATPWWSGPSRISPTSSRGTDAPSC
jgi:low affinity Fe/Cu permease